ncbi:MAG TPA: low affinity iron permease family protein [Gemmatimonadaceae bacterium]|jgi:low affinity Fe/Cu permease|nr:low affinity iron permease family protein [Gemmatimonadaceae bacterium]
MREMFRKLSTWTAAAVGSPWAFLLAVAVTVAWAVVGPEFHYTDTWQLVMNTTSSIVTFLMVFLIQHTQNRDALAMQIKLDELLRAVAHARTGLVDIEDLSDGELNALQKEFERLRVQEMQAQADERNDRPE